MLPPPGTPGTDLPVRAVLGELTDALARHGTAVLVAPPGTGKTSLVPLELAATGTVLVAEPRRVAARAAARRMASLVGERVGDRVGFSVRGESKRSAATRIEVVTTGLLLRRLQADPELPGVDVVLLDEVHERQTDTDLALAFALDVRASLRPDLRLLAMSATAQAQRLAELLGGAPVVEATGALFDVETVWCPPRPPVQPPLGTRVDPRLLDAVADTVRRALAETTGDVLVFLPGAAEIGGVQNRLGGLDVDVRPLHGRLPSAEQDAALTAGPRRRVVLATDVAESSLTVPGVRVVVDAGLARTPRVDLSRGLGALVTVPASVAAATQRAGRAGREGPGRVYRLWSEAEHGRRPAAPEPEMATADLTPVALELATWGAPGGVGLALLDPPPESALAVAEQTLRTLGAVDDRGRVTDRGRQLSGVGAHPRLARALVDGTPLVGRRRAAEVVALLSADGSPRSDDLVAALREARQGHGPWREEVRRLERAVPDVGRTDLTDDAAAGLVTALAHPEWLARRRPKTERTYLLAAGTGAELPQGTALGGAEWIAVAAADRAPGRRDARVRLAVAVDQGTALEVGEHTDGPEVVWRDGDVRAARVERLGAIVLTQRPLPDPDPDLVAAAVAEGLRTEGLSLLRWTPAATSLRERLAAAHAGLGEPWPAVDDRTLSDALGATPQVRAARNRHDLRRLDVLAALRALVPWELAGVLEDAVPEKVVVPGGGEHRVDYTNPESPTASMRVQEAFGWKTTPTVAGRPLRLELLSPARRVVATTGDLAGFWTTGYPTVRSELKGRYPKHPWPEDPARALPIRRAKPRG